MSAVLAPIRAVREFRGSMAATRPPAALWVIFGIFAVLASLGPNPVIGLIGIAVLAGVSVILWRPAEPQTLLFIAGYQWLQGYAPVFRSIIHGETISRLMGGDDFELSTLLTLLGVGVFAVGLRLTTRPPKHAENRQLMEGVKQLNRTKLLYAWVVLSALSTVLATAGAMMPGLRQALVAFEVWKWAVVLLIFFRWMSSGEGGVMAAGVLIAEASVGMLGYFSAFKEVFILLLVAATGGVARSRRAAASLTGVFLILVVLLCYWQAVKAPYRQYLSQGERSQSVDVSVSSRVNWLASAVGDVTTDSLRAGWDEGLKRLGYVEYFGICLSTVPTVVDHTDGKLWKEAVMHPLTPRLLFPEKGVINDSDRTSAYTGINVAGAEQGTSISIGYIGESYIDFGYLGMFVPLLLWGMLVGWCFEFLRRKAPHPLFGVVLAACLLLSTAMLLESSNIKMLGGMISGFLVTGVLMHFFGNNSWKWLTTGRPAPAAFPAAQRALRRR